MLNVLVSKIDENLNWSQDINDIMIKLKKADALLYKIRASVNLSTPKSIDVVIFEAHLNYANLVWAHNTNTLQRVSVVQKETLITIF